MNIKYIFLLSVLAVPAINALSVAERIRKAQDALNACENRSAAEILMSFKYNCTKESEEFGKSLDEAFDGTIEFWAETKKDSHNLTEKQERIRILAVGRWTEYIFKLNNFLGRNPISQFDKEVICQFSEEIEEAEQLIGNFLEDTPSKKQE
jgi:hypothetical protein